MRTIITDSIRNVNRIIRRLNYSGQATYGTEVVTAVGLAWQMIMEKCSENGLCNIRLISNSTATSIVLGLLADDINIKPVVTGSSAALNSETTDGNTNTSSNFSLVPADSLCLAAAREVLNNMNLLRCNDYMATALNNADDIERISYLEKLIERYETTLIDRNLYDGPLVLKKVLEILDAYLEINTKSISGASIETCYFSKISTLEQSFVSKLGKFTEFTKPSPNELTYKFVRTYGIVNEVDYVVQTIVNEKIPLGDVEIICDTSIYASFIEESCAKRGIKFNFTSPVSASGFRQIRLIKDLISWYTSGCNYEKLFNVCHNPLFVIKNSEGIHSASNPYLKGISYGIGWGAERYLSPQVSTYDAEHSVSESEINKQFRETELPELGKLATELDSAVQTGSAVAALDTILAYIKPHIRTSPENKFMSGALSLLRKNLSESAIKFHDPDELFDYLVAGLDSVTYSESESADAVNVSSIFIPACPERKHIFIIGLSAAELKISTSESPVLNDELRIKLFGNPPIGNVTLAEQAIDDTEAIIRTTISGAPEGSIVTLISSQADVMRDGSTVAASSLFEKLLSEQNAEIINETGYYDITCHDVKNTHEDAWGEYIPNWNIQNLGTEKKAETYKDTDNNETNTIKKTFSKSTLDDFLECPLRSHYDRELHINKEEYTKYDPGEWLDHKEKGTFIHGILENYANAVLKDNENVSETFDRENPEFVRAVESASEKARKNNSAPNPETMNRELVECVDMATDYLTYLHQNLSEEGWTVWRCEEEINPEWTGSRFNYDGVKFDITYSGCIDRIDRKPAENGTYVYRIIDYKTGKAYTAEDMLKKTKQHLIYAKYIEDNFGKVVCFEYQYIGHMSDGDDWIARIDGDKLATEVISDIVDKDHAMSDKELMATALAKHDYLTIGRVKFADDKARNKACTYCRYKDVCLYDLCSS